MAGVVKSMEAAAKSMDLQKVHQFTVITYQIIPHANFHGFYQCNFKVIWWLTYPE